MGPKQKPSQFRGRPKADVPKMHDFCDYAYIDAYTGESLMKNVHKTIIALLTAGILFACSPPTSAGSESAAPAVLPPGIVSKAEPTTFVEGVAKINATPAFFKALAAQPDVGPTINLNFIRCRPRTDCSMYNKYGAVAGAGILGVGGDIIHHADAVKDANKIFEFSDEWDVVAYAMYPSRAGYLQLQRDTDYQEGIKDRVAGTYERMLYVLSDGEAIYEATGSITNFHKTNTRIEFDDGNVVVSEFLRFKKDGGRAEYEKFAALFAPMLKKAGGEVALSVRAEMPIVSEEYWDHFVSFKYPSMKAMKDLMQTSEFTEINIHRINGLDGSLTVLGNPTKMPPKPSN
jgi:uncharacterized protein (DUF1330 family)